MARLCILLPIYVASMLHGNQNPNEMECDMADNEIYLSTHTRNKMPLSTGSEERSNWQGSIQHAPQLSYTFYNPPGTIKTNNKSPDKPEGQYRYAAVSSDAPMCSTVGTDLMARRGATAVDAAIATSLCRCIYHFHSCGIGGGFFMTAYNREKKETFTINAREMAPEGSYTSMFKGRSALFGGLSIAVPSDIKGLWLAHQKGGKLPWRDLFQPAIQMCREGTKISKPTAIAIKNNIPKIEQFSNLKRLLTNPETGTYFVTGDVIYRPELANTLSIIAEEGADAFYNGSLTDAIVSDIRESGGIITRKDLSGDVAVYMEPVQINLTGGYTVYVAPPPSGGVVLEFILNVLDGYNMKPPSNATQDEIVLTWHRIIETFKFGAAEKTKLFDTTSDTEKAKANMKKALTKLTSKKYAEKIRSKISGDMTFDPQYYGPIFHDPSLTGTSHLSVLAANGDAVSMTNTINNAFGSKVVGSRTGIIFNNEMIDFAIPYIMEPAVPANMIEPHKRPMSSMCPAIMVDDTGMVRLVIGASGGTRAITSTALVTILTHWLGMGIKQAIDHKRAYNILNPDTLGAEAGFPEYILDGLSQKGHNITKGFTSVVQGILQRENGKITAYADQRKFGSTDGF